MGLPRKVDDKKTKKALRKLRRAADRAKSDDGPGLTDWEEEFVDGVEKRLTTYGSAFNDLEKGAADEALSAKQKQIVRELEKKARGKRGAADAGPKRRSGFKQKTPMRPRARDINDDLREKDKADTVEEPVRRAKQPVVVEAANHRESDPAPSKPSKPHLKLIEGGLSEAAEKEK
ncbi:MAG: hypothetical protein AAF719_08375 [Pseudomonadota bacterium]